MGPGGAVGCEYDGQCGRGDCGVGKGACVGFFLLGLGAVGRKRRDVWVHALQGVLYPSDWMLSGFVNVTIHLDGRLRLQWALSNTLFRHPGYTCEESGIMMIEEYS